LLPTGDCASVAPASSSEDFGGKGGTPESDHGHTAEPLKHGASIMSGLAEVDRYRRKSAQAAERKAAAAKDPTVKQRFVRIAEHWRALAEDTQEWSSLLNRAQHHELRYARRHPF
jgi:hypothetical protein